MHLNAGSIPSLIEVVETSFATRDTKSESVTVSPVRVRDSGQPRILSSMAASIQSVYSVHPRKTRAETFAMPGMSRPF